MILQIYIPPTIDYELKDCKLGDINDAISLEYEKFFCGVGTFTLEISPASIFADKIAVNTLIYSRDDDMCWIVKNIKTESDKITVTGYDLNGILLDRLTMPTESDEAGTEGKDAVAGSTEACVKHFVEYNLVSSEMSERNIPRMEISENLDRGIGNDTYLASKECLEDVVRTMCARAELGYRVSLNLNTSGPGSKPIVFDVAEQRDCSADQDENNRVIFSVGMRNVSGIEREIGVTAEKNALWCEVGGLDGFINAADDEIPAGWGRREEYVSLSVTDPFSQSQVTDAARQEMADKFAQTDSLTVDAGNPLDYGTVYDLGDVVTVYDNERSAQLNSVISAVSVKRTATEYTVKLTLGEAKPKLLDGLARKSDLTSKYQRDFPVTIPDRITDNLRVDVVAENIPFWNAEANVDGIYFYSHNGSKYHPPRPDNLNNNSLPYAAIGIEKGDSNGTLNIVQFTGYSSASVPGASNIIIADMRFLSFKADTITYTIKDSNGVRTFDLTQGSGGVEKKYVDTQDESYFEQSKEYTNSAVNTVAESVTQLSSSLTTTNNKVQTNTNDIAELRGDLNELQSEYAYTTKIAFKTGGFALTFADKDGNEFVNNFSVTESGGKITKITNVTAGKEIMITYE